MSKTVRENLQEVVAACWQERSPVIWENARGDDLTILTDGYLKFAVSITGASDMFMAPKLLSEGQIFLTLAVPLGKGMAHVDSGVTRLDNHLSNKQFGSVRTASLQAAPAYASAGFWLTDIELDFLIWKGTA
ncbi:hypothetical protein N9X12_09095 [Alphaproteobacteria bacterium]|nr:hypothetical protein [Alphaproteobacteria bacterium]